MLQSIWASPELEHIFNTSLSAPLTTNITGVSIDSRTLNPGDLFFALTSETADGHDYLQAAADKGAAAAVVQRPIQNPPCPILIVPDVFIALQQLGAAGRARFNGKIIAITGSSGKTSTKEMLAYALSSFGSCHATAGNFNNHLGVPITLATLPPSNDFAVIEIGMNHPGEIAPLSNMARPDIAMITSIAAGHLAAFANIAGIAAEKSDIVAGLCPGGIAIVNHDHDYMSVVQQRLKQQPGISCQTYGHSNIRSYTPGQPSQANITIGDDVTTLNLSLPGKHQAINAVGVLYVIQALNLPIQQATEKLTSLLPGKRRGQMLTLNLPQGNIQLFDDSYNANPASMIAALDVLANLPGRQIAVLGDMRELGTTGPQLHADLAQHLLRNKIQHLFCCGPLMQSLYRALPETIDKHWTETPAQLAEILIPYCQAGDILLVKGSNGSKMTIIIETLLSICNSSTIQKTA